MITLVIIMKALFSIVVVAAGFFAASKMVDDQFVTYPVYYWQNLAGFEQKVMVLVAALFNIAWVSVLIWNVWF